MALAMIRLEAGEASVAVVCVTRVNAFAVDVDSLLIGVEPLRKGLRYEELKGSRCRGAFAWASNRVLRTPTASCLLAEVFFSDKVFFLAFSSNSGYY